ncbi:hypothetical protein [Spiroplasma endosymbiont of Polydrusus pterygomalis]|uniref:hypothetical protein n=1 Tax=Spiroplasma endosymbiont of Polydrusus pterygomalis TaxID=3139327 RepID=UPI003CCB5693
MGIHEILQLIGDCLMAIGVCLGGHHTIKSHIKNKIKMSKKERKELKLRQKLEKLNSNKKEEIKSIY